MEDLKKIEPGGNAGFSRFGFIVNSRDLQKEINRLTARQLTEAEAAEAAEKSAAAVAEGFNPVEWGKARRCPPFGRRENPPRGVYFKRVNGYLVVVENYNGREIVKPGFMFGVVWDGKNAPQITTNWRNKKFVRRVRKSDVMPRACEEWERRGELKTRKTMSYEEFKQILTRNYGGRLLIPSETYFLEEFGITKRRGIYELYDPEMFGA